MTKAKRLSSAEKSRRYRERMRSKGMRLMQVWVPNTEDPRFVEECNRQAKIIAESEEGDLDFYEEGDIEGWEP